MRGPAGAGVTIIISKSNYSHPLCQAWMSKDMSGLQSTLQNYKMIQPPDIDSTTQQVGVRLPRRYPTVHLYF